MDVQGKELAKGGRLLLVNFCVDEQGRYLGNTEHKQSMFDVMNRVRTPDALRHRAERGIAMRE
jgi:hypothetical protein